MNIGPPPQVLVEQESARDRRRRRNHLLEGEFDADSHALNAFTMFGAACVITMFWIQALTSVNQRELVVYNTQEHHSIYMGNMPSSFGPKISKKGLGGILYYQPDDIYGCKIGNNTLNQTFVNINKFYNNTFKFNDMEENDDLNIVKQEEELVGGLSSANGEGNTLQNFIYELNRLDWQETPILLVRRGGVLSNGHSCTFIDKVRMAQQMGVKAVVVYDNIEESSDSNNMPRLITMASSHQKKLNDEIKIPSVFISRKDGNELIRLLNPTYATTSHQETWWDGFKSNFLWPRGRAGDAFYLSKSPKKSRSLRSINYPFNEQEIVDRKLKEIIPSSTLPSSSTSQTHHGIPVIIQNGSKIVDPLHSVAQRVLSGVGLFFAFCSCSTLVFLALFSGRFDFLHLCFNIRAQPRRPTLTRQRFFGARRGRGVGLLTQSELESLNSYVYTRKEEEISNDSITSTVLDNSDNGAGNNNNVPQIGSNNNNNNNNNNNSNTSNDTNSSIVHNSDDSDDACSICLSSFSPGNKLIILPCFHKFHAHCVGEWLTRWNGTCPLCKQQALPHHHEWDIGEVDNEEVGEMGRSHRIEYRDTLYSSVDFRDIPNTTSHFQPQLSSMMTDDELASVLRQIELQEVEDARTNGLLFGGSSNNQAIRYNPFTYLPSSSGSTVNSAEQIPLIRPSPFLPRTRSARHSAIEVRTYGSVGASQDDEETET